MVSAIVKGGEIFVLETGDVVRILDLGRRLILRSGRTVRMPGESEGDIEIIFTELQCGEKLVEELNNGLVAYPTRYPCIARVDQAPLPNRGIEALVTDLKLACHDRRTDQAIQILGDIIGCS